MFKFFGAISAWSSLAIDMADGLAAAQQALADVKAEWDLKQAELAELAEQQLHIKRMQLQLDKLKLEAKLYTAEAEKHTATTEAQATVAEPDYMDEEEFFGTIV